MTRVRKEPKEEGAESGKIRITATSGRRGFKKNVPDRGKHVRKSRGTEGQPQCRVPKKACKVRGTQRNPHGSKGVDQGIKEGSQEKNPKKAKGRRERD